VADATVRIVIRFTSARVKTKAAETATFSLSELRREKFKTPMVSHMQNIDCFNAKVKCGCPAQKLLNTR